MIRKGLAYVDDLTPEQMREYRGTLTEPGKNSLSRDRTIAENLDLFALEERRIEGKGPRSKLFPSPAKNRSEPG